MSTTTRPSSRGHRARPGAAPSPATTARAARSPSEPVAATTIADVLSQWPDGWGVELDSGGKVARVTIRPSRHAIDGYRPSKRIASRTRRPPRLRTAPRVPPRPRPAERAPRDVRPVGLEMRMFDVLCARDFRLLEPPRMGRRRYRRPTSRTRRRWNRRRATAGRGSGDDGDGAASAHARPAGAR